MGDPLILPSTLSWPSRSADGIEDHAQGFVDLIAFKYSSLALEDGKSGGEGYRKWDVEL
jgi:hypothetical protein